MAGSWGQNERWTLASLQLVLTYPCVCPPVSLLTSGSRLCLGPPSSGSVPEVLPPGHLQATPSLGWGWSWTTFLFPAANSAILDHAPPNHLPGPGLLGGSAGQRPPTGWEGHCGGGLRLTPKSLTVQT